MGPNYSFVFQISIGAHNLLVGRFERSFVSIMNPYFSTVSFIYLIFYIVLHNKCAKSQILPDGRSSNAKNTRNRPYFINDSSQSPAG